MEERTVFVVTDLKQYAYCPRIVYYTYCLPLLRPTTGKMEDGRLAHEEMRRKERRRTLAMYDLGEGKKHFDVVVASERLGMRGRIDLVIETEEEWIPVDYKQTDRRVGAHIRQQIGAYGILLEETMGVRVRRGLVYSLLGQRVEEIPLTARLRREVEETVAAMREMVKRERMPDPPASSRQCMDCEFRRFCNDVL